MSYDFKKLKESVPIERVLARWNIHPDPRQGNNEWKSYRTDFDGRKHKDPCFSIGVKRNILRDFRDGQNYTVIDVVMKLMNCGLQDAARWLGETFGIEEVNQHKTITSPTPTAAPATAAAHHTPAKVDLPFPEIEAELHPTPTPPPSLEMIPPTAAPSEQESEPEPPQHHEPKIIVSGVRSLVQSQRAAEYLAGRGIPVEYAKDVCRGIWYQYTSDPTNKKWWGVGFRNRAKAWVIRNSLDSHLSKFQIGSQDITLIEAPQSPFFAVFEGFIDFLSWRVLAAKDSQFHVLNGINVIVLNSIVNYKKAFQVLDGGARQIALMLDNDPPKEPGKESPGDATTRKFLERYPRTAKDMRFMYASYKDVNECLMNFDCPF